MYVYIYTRYNLHASTNTLRTVALSGVALYVCLSICIYMYIYIYIYIYIYMCVCVCVCVYMCIYIRGTISMLVLIH